MQNAMVIIGRLPEEYLLRENECTEKNEDLLKNRGKCRYKLLAVLNIHLPIIYY